ncbi:dTDP-4-dehydrorhamnose reductase [Pikeienuella piscinae]|uniref:dTDP-4-dehydrorhamnose reductase n=1 Tax=Pikeienuella piscinae TaxID=2748098 RepID=UPI001FEBA51B|nr:dTDP-4-dehydrorhamnose reductase [Pikeienuella piscinae]
MRVLMFGRTGQVAREVIRRDGDVAITALGRADVDLSEPKAAEEAVLAADVDAVLNAAAWTDVDGAEAEEAAAARINADAPAAIARAAAKRGLPFLHISTDYVFDGAGTTPWREGDRPAPKSAYGRTKLKGEQAVAAAAGPHVVLRTAWVFSSHGKNFVKTMLRVGAGRDRLTVVDDQVGGPTPAAAIAEACLDILAAHHAGRGVSGVFHFAGAPAVSWRGFAEAIFEEAGMDVDVAPIATEDWPTPAERPLNSRLDCAAIRAAYGIVQPDWRAGLRDVLKELKS